VISADLSFLRAVAPRFTGEKARVQAAILDAVAPRYFATLRASEIDTPLRIAHFTAQVAHESAGFRAVEEFADGRAYEGRLDLGNTQPGDGTRYKGRGLIQLTGRANYRAIGRVLGLDLEARPALAAEPVNALSIACAYWNGRGLNRSADADDLNAVTRGINGGFNGLSDRRRYLVRAKAALAGASDDAADPLLRRGARGGAVEDLQRLLCGAGASLSVDGVFGAATHAAVLAFQRGRGLAADGIVGPKTWAALRS
jgi:putative chitinase